jgi:hypothetical protein
MADQLSTQLALTNLNRLLARFAARNFNLQSAVSGFSAPILAASMSVLVGCGGGLSGGSSSPASSTPESTPSAQCATPQELDSQDVAGGCRSAPTTMGALEVGSGSPAGAQTIATAVSATPNTPSGFLQVTWQPIGTAAAGYVVYYGRTAETASVLVSDLPTSAGHFDPATPSVTYDSARDLGLYAGDSACFKIFAYDVARALSSESTVVCTTV